MLDVIHVKYMNLEDFPIQIRQFAGLQAKLNTVLTVCAFKKSQKKHIVFRLYEPLFFAFRKDFFEFFDRYALPSCKSIQNLLIPFRLICEVFFSQHKHRKLLPR